MSLHGSISLDYSQALQAMRKFRTEYRETMNMPTVIKIGAEGGTTSTNSAASSRQVAQQNARAQVAIAKESARAQGQIALELTRQQGKNDLEGARQKTQIARDAAKLQIEIARETMRAETQLTIEASRAQERANRSAEINAQRSAAASVRNKGTEAREATRLQQSVAREAAKRQAENQREAARVQVQTARDAARAQNQIALEQSRQQGRASLESSRQQSQAARDAVSQQAQLGRETLRQKSQDAREAARILSREAQENARAQERAARDLSRQQLQSARDVANEKRRIDQETARQAVRAQRAQNTAERAAKRNEEKAESESESANDKLGDKASNAATVAGVGILGGFGLALNESIKFEESFSDVEKTVDATDAQLTDIQRRLRDMAAGKNPIPIDVNELNKIAASGGQLGIATENIVGFTRTMAEMGVTTNLTSDDAATSMARIANITQMPQDKFDELGSTIVDLGNKFASNEKEITEMGLRLAGAGHQIGLTQAEILGFANALASVGIEAEAGGTSFSTVFSKIDKAVKMGGESLSRFARVSGMSSKEFKASYEKDAAGTIKTFVEGLARIQKSGGNTFAALEKLGLGETRVRDALLRTAGAGDLLSRSLDTSTQAWEQNTALQNESAKKFGTTGAQITITKNIIRELGLETARTMIPAFRSGIRFTRDLLSGFNALPESTRDNIVKLTALAGVVLLVGGRMKALWEICALVKTGLFGVQVAAGAAGAGAGAAGARVGGLFNSLKAMALFLKANPMVLTISFGIGAGAGIYSWLQKEGILGKDAAPVGEATVNVGKRVGHYIRSGNFVKPKNLISTALGRLPEDLLTGYDREEAAKKAARDAKALIDPLGDPGRIYGPGISPAQRAKLAKPSTRPKSGADDLSGGESDKEKRARESAESKARRLAESAAQAEIRADLKRTKDMLADGATAWDRYAQSMEQATDRQIRAAQEMRDGVIGTLQSIESKLIDAGAPLNGFYKAVDAIRGLVGDRELLGKLSLDGDNAAQDARDRANSYRSQSEQIDDNDGVVAGQGGASFSAPKIGGAGVGAKIARAAIAGLNDSDFTRVKGECQKFVRQVLGTVSGEFEKYRGGTASEAGRKFKRAGLGRARENAGALLPGDVLYRIDGGAGHTGIYVGKGLVAENTSGSRGTKIQGAKRLSPVGAFNYNTVVRAGGWGKPSDAVVDGDSVQVGAKGTSSTQTAGLPSGGLDKLLASMKRADLQKTYEQYSKSGVAELYKNHRYETPNNGSRREMLKYLATTDFNKKLDDAGDVKGLKGASLEAWKNKIKAAMYAVSNLADSELKLSKAHEAVTDTKKLIKSDEIRVRLMRSTNAWLKDNTYNQVEYSKAQDVARFRQEQWADAAIQSQFAADKLNKTNLASAEVNKRVASYQRTLNAQLRSTAFAEHTQRVSQLNQEYSAINDETLEQIAARKVLTRADAAYLSQKEKELEIETELRNSRAQSEKALKDASRDRLKGVYSAGETTRNPVEAALMAQWNEDEESRRKDAPDLGYIATPLTLMQTRAKEIRATMSAWTAQSLESSMQSVNELFADGLITASKIRETVNGVWDKIHSGQQAPGTGPNQATIDQLNGEANANNMSGRFDKLSAGISDGTREASDALTEYSRKDETVVDQAKRVYQASLRQIEVFKNQARSMGVDWTIFGDGLKVVEQQAKTTLDATKELYKRQQFDLFDNAASDMQFDIAQSRLSKADAEFAVMVRDWKKQGLSDSQIDELLNIEHTRQAAQTQRSLIIETLGGIEGEFGSLWGNLKTEGLNAFDTLFAGITDKVEAFGIQMLQNAVWKQLEGMFGSFLGLGGAPAAASSGGGLLDGIVKTVAPVGAGLFGGNNLGSGFSLNGSHENGLDRVPFNGYKALLHKDETVLNARQAKQWKMLKSGAANQSANRADVGNSSTRSSGNVSITNIHVEKMVSSDTKSIERDARKAGQSKSKSQIQGAASDFMTGY